MSLPHALLGLLKYKPNTGYEIKTAFESSINFFWDVSLPQIYRTLNNMEDQGWLESDIEHQESKPNKKIYHVTKEGDQEFQQWLELQPERVRAKDELLVKLFFGNFTDREVIIRHIRERSDGAREFLDSSVGKIEPTAHDFAQKADASEDITYWLLTLDFGRRRAQMTLDWCNEALKILQKK